MSSPPIHSNGLDANVPQLPPAALQAADGRTLRQERSNVAEHERQKSHDRIPFEYETTHQRTRSRPSPLDDSPNPLAPPPADPRTAHHRHENMIDKHRRMNEKKLVNQQPKAKEEMKINPRNALKKPLDEEGQRDWSYGLRDYKDKAAVWRAALLPCVVYARNARRWDHLDRHDAPHPEPGKDSIPQCIGHGCATLCCFSWCLCMSQRGRVRERYNIVGDMGDDLAEACVCYPCALHQEERELDLEERTLQEIGADGKEFYTYQAESGGPNFFTPVSGDIGGNGCSCFNCCFLCY